MKTIGVAGEHVTAWDAGRGPALVVIHGAGTPGALLRTDMAELSRNARVITYDRRGYGESSPAPESWEEHREDAAAVITELGAAPAVVLGYSAGAIVALDLALEHRELVAGLVLLDPAVYVKRSPTPGLVPRWPRPGSCAGPAAPSGASRAGSATPRATPPVARHGTRRCPPGGRRSWPIPKPSSPISTWVAASTSTRDGSPVSTCR